MRDFPQLNTPNRGNYSEQCPWSRVLRKFRSTLLELKVIDARKHRAEPLVSRAPLIASLKAGIPAFDQSE